MAKNEANNQENGESKSATKRFDIIGKSNGERYNIALHNYVVNQAQLQYIVFADIKTQKILDKRLKSQKVLDEISKQFKKLKDKLSTKEKTKSNEEINYFDDGDLDLD
jgi:uncharacterized protein YjaZ